MTNDRYFDFIPSENAYLNIEYKVKVIAISEFELSDDRYDGHDVYIAVGYCPDDWKREDGFVACRLLQIEMLPGYGIESVTNPDAWECLHTFIGTGEEGYYCAETKTYRTEKEDCEIYYAE